MKFLLVGGFSDSMVRFRGSLIDALQAQGFEVHVAAPELLENIGVKQYFEDRGVGVHNISMNRTGKNPLSDLRTLLSIYRVARKIKATHFMGYTIKPVIYGSLAAYFAKVPSRYALITGLGHAFQDSKRVGWLQFTVEKLYAISLSKVKTTFFQNSDDEELFRRRAILGARANTCVVNGSGIDLDSFSMAEISDKQIRFLLIARLLGEKGVRLYASAAKEIRQKYPSVKFGLVGWLDDNPDCVKKEELDLWIKEGSIEYFGRLNDVRQALADCSIFVLPTFYREGVPRTILEALAIGRPIITTDSPGCRETVLEGQNGFLIPVRSHEALVDAMMKFVNQPEIIPGMGRASRRLAEEKFDVHLVNSQMIGRMRVNP